MRTLTRLCLVFVMVAVASTMVHAGRPQCANTTRLHGVCFVDEELTVFNGYTVWTGAMALDTGLAFAVYYQGNDLCMLQPTGEWLCQATEARAQLVVCPDRGFQCLADWFGTETWPNPLPEMYVGEGRWTRALKASPDFEFVCPDTGNIRGQVFDGRGEAYLFTGAHNFRKTPTGCQMMKAGLELEAM